MRKIRLRRTESFLLSAAGVLLVLFVTAFALLPLPGHVPVLMYHFVRGPEEAEASKNNVSTESFSRQMRFLSTFGYRVLSLEDLEAIRTGSRRPRGREIVITFDDGNYTFEKNAYPILRQYAFPVTLFLVSDNVKKGLHGSMTEPVIKKLLRHAWIGIGSHSKTHPVLSELTEAEIRTELVESKKELEKMFGREVSALAYPSGVFDSRTAELARESGYRLAFTTSQKKLKGLPEGSHTLKRVKISRTADSPLVFWIKISGIYSYVKDRVDLLKQWGKKEAVSASRAKEAGAPPETLE